MWHTLCLKLDDGCTSPMQRCPVIFNTNYTAGLWHHGLTVYEFAATQKLLGSTPCARPSKDDLIEFGLQWKICLCYSSKQTGPITMKFCTFQDSCAVLECAKFLCDWIDVREDKNECILKFNRNLFSGMGTLCSETLLSISSEVWHRDQCCSHALSHLTQPNCTHCFSSNIWGLLY